jgi:hypothetical protein
MKPSCEAAHAIWLPFYSLQATTMETKEDRVWKQKENPNHSTWLRVKTQKERIKILISQSGTTVLIPQN